VKCDSTRKRSSDSLNELVAYQSPLALFGWIKTLVPRRNGENIYNHYWTGEMLVLKQPDSPSVSFERLLFRCSRRHECPPYLRQVHLLRVELSSLVELRALPQDVWAVSASGRCCDN